jgi:predicted PhzF superfamily epimerase YddE/YHI9
MVQLGETLMKQSIVQVDAFTNTPFAGNPAAVCVLTEPRDDRWLQNVAGEMNLSETAFLLPQQDGYNLRWFTPAVEVKLCGHATLASAHVLWETGQLAPTREARFQTLSGLLTANRRDSWIEMNFPATVEHEAAPPPGLLAALNVEATYVGKNQFDYLVEVSSEEIVRSMLPDLALLSTIAARGVMVTSRASSNGYDFVSRFFAPQVGVPEDPVTGSAHCCLAPYWASRLGKEEMQAFQASARGGVVRVRVAGDRVYLSGQAVTVMQGELLA